MLYVETVSSIMYDISRLSVPCNISDPFTEVNNKNTYAQDQELLFRQLLYKVSESEPKTNVFCQILELNFGILNGTNFDKSLKLPLQSMTCT